LSDLSNLGPSLVRTLVPIVVGAAGGYGVTYLHLTTDQETTLASAVIGFVYYVVVRVAEHHWPASGALLGVPQAPVYTGALGGVVETLVAAAVDAELAKRAVPPPSVPPPQGPSWADLASLTGQYGAPPFPTLR
jgi:hypothetical protein